MKFLSLTFIAALMLGLSGTVTSGQEYMFPESSNVRLTDDDLKPLTCMQLWLARNEIFNRNGYCFSTNLGRKSFDNSDCWTKNAKLSPLENQNVALIQRWERWHNCRVN